MTVRELVTKLGFEVDEGKMKKAEASINKLKQVGKIAALGIIAGIAAIGIASIKAAADMEMLTTQFEVMLGSAEKATAMMEQLEEFAAGTPFQLPDLAQGTQTLLSFGVAEKDVIRTMRMLGDAAMGNSEKLKGLILAYGKVQSKGKVSMEEINMIAEKGVPIIQTLIDQLGIKKGMEGQFFKMVSAGKLGRKHIQQAFKTMTSEGGKFYQGMLKSSKTFIGVMSTLKDILGIVAASIGKTMLPLLKKFAIKVIAIAMKVREWVKLNKGKLEESFQNMAKIIKKIVKILFQFGKILFWIATSPIGAMILGIVVALKTYAIVMGIVNVVQALWNALLIANPIGIVIAAIGALIAITFVAIKNWKAIGDFFKKMWENIVLVFDKGVAMIKALLASVWAFLKKWGLRILIIFAPFIAVPILVIKNWKKIINFFRNFRGNMRRIIVKVKDTLIWAFTHPIEVIKKMWGGIANFFKRIFDSIMDTFNSMIQAANDVVPGLKIKEFEKTKAESNAEIRKQLFQMLPGNKIVNAPMSNKIDINIQGEIGGKDAGAIGNAVAKATRSVFALELRKVLISAG